MRLLRIMDPVEYIDVKNKTEYRCTEDQLHKYTVENPCRLSNFSGHLSDSSLTSQ